MAIHENMSDFCRLIEGKYLEQENYLSRIDAFGTAFWVRN